MSDAPNTMKNLSYENRRVGAAPCVTSPALMVIPLLLPLAATAVVFEPLSGTPTAEPPTPGPSQEWVLTGRLATSFVPQGYGDGSAGAPSVGWGVRSMEAWASPSQLNARAAIEGQTGFDSLVEAVISPLASAAFAGASMQPGPSIVLEWGASDTIQVEAGLAGQKIPIFLRNNGSAIEVGGLDLKFGLEGGAAPYPAFTGVDLRASPSFDSPDSPFQVSNSVQGPDANNTPQLQFWSVSINDPFNPPSLPGGGAVTQIGVVTLSTVGVAGGSWSLLFRSEATALTDPFGDELALGLRNAQLQAVPEPEEVATLSAVLLMGGAWLLRRGSFRPSERLG